MYSTKEEKVPDKQDEGLNGKLWIWMKNHIDELLWHLLWGRTITDLHVLPEEPYAKVRSKIINAVLDKCKDDNEMLKTVFPYSGALKETEIIDRILECKEKGPKHDLLTAQSKSTHLTALSRACKIGNKEAAEYLLTKLKSLEIVDEVIYLKDRRGYTAWDHAWKSKSYETAELLLKNVTKQLALKLR